MSDHDLETKDLGALEIKDADKGEVEAVVATLNVVDKDAEIIMDGAIKDGAKVKLSAYGHDSVFGASPVGKGALHLDGDRVLFKGRFFTSTDRGADAFQTIKEMGSEQEWSFGFRVMKSEEPDDEQRAKGARRVLKKLDAFEVSPVILAAGIGTQTLAVKEVDDEALKAEAEARDHEVALQEAQRLDVEIRQAAAEEFSRFERTRRRLGS